ncbi:MAG: hypothetical protein A2622_09235 [Bdellovibrionales bacterium RIFCSPHIGHO2_01_FULL_40_29]|nr:MAG: hypothetical protein A2622_09235 [Bdellovibrionales bacterium RIFCSPHIGHO2_01_FULL_40_29]OFZ33592.1 MAG: hypothetical protein A3D17_00395 [Bdellovibrionales bacterium RIFCSPHIGHO2_02_FULL_40_15]
MISRYCLYPLGLAVITVFLFTANLEARPPADSFMQVRPFSAPTVEDNFLVFLENLTTVTNIYQLEAHGLNQGRSAFEPWAGSYWPIHQGILGLRYADSAFPKSKSFIENYSAVQSRPSNFMIENGEINKLSPSEKYDLLIGDRNFTLTHHMWNKGLTGFQTDGFVATWTGICHGWSAATHMGVPSSEKSVTVKDVTGNFKISFYPQDIKGLQSFLWANSAPTSVRSGDRCRQSVIDRDPFLRPIDPTCLDSNPMSWHLAVTNKVGLHQSSFVMDSSAGTEVWNYPVMSYDSSYFNPRTFISSHSLLASMESVENLKTDKYASFRHPSTKYVVGVAMDVFHPALVSPRVGTSQGNVIQYKSFIYDLELDENYMIIGGEWYSKERPDFLWSFPAGSQAGNSEDSLIEDVEWDLNSALPEAIADKARMATGRGKVLRKIANALLAASISIPESDDEVTPEEPIAIPTPE